MVVPWLTVQGAPRSGAHPEGQGEEVQVELERGGLVRSMVVAREWVVGVDAR